MFRDFSYDGVTNNTYGVACVSFESVDTVISACGETTLTQEHAGRGNTFHLVSQPYSAPLSFTLEIMKCDGTSISRTLQAQLIQWLCKRGMYKWFNILDDGRSDIYYRANISNPQLIYFGGVVGMSFTVSCDAPYGYTNEIVRTLTIANANDSVSFIIDTEDDDYIYPEAVITVGGNGTLSITRTGELLHRDFIISNVINGEVLTMDSSIPTISSTNNSHNPYADSNKQWLRLLNGTNELSFSLPCTCVLTYREVRKVGIV